MKPTILILLAALAVSGCAKKQDAHRQTKQTVRLTSKIVKAKNKAEETTYHYKYNFWKGNFYHVPDVHTVFYLVYTDGSYEKVDIGKFTITNVGDTIK